MNAVRVEEKSYAMPPREGFIIASLPRVTKGGLEACRRDVPDVCLRVLDPGHLVRDPGADQICVLPQNVASDGAPALVEQAG